MPRLLAGFDRAAGVLGLGPVLDGKPSQPSTCGHRRVARTMDDAIRAVPTVAAANL